MIHSFWVPEFGQKQDAVPGLLTKLVITPKRLGTFPVICTELCGLGHALMRSEAIVLSEDKFLSWTKSQRGGGATGAGARAAASGKALFVSNGCDGCHTFKPAGAKGTVGPDLDNLRRPRRQAGQPLEQFIHQSIVDPNAYVEPGYQKGVMPETFSTLPKQQLDALVKYLRGVEVSDAVIGFHEHEAQAGAPAARGVAARLPPPARAGLAARRLVRCRSSSGSAPASSCSSAGSRAGIRSGTAR